MAEAKSIETLSLSFTAGVVAGTFLPCSHPVPLLLLVILPFFFQDKLARLPAVPCAALIGTVFVGLGVFCAWSSSLAGLENASLLQRVADSAVLRLRKHIDTLPFPSDGTAPLLKALLTADRSGLSAETLQVFRQSGAAHILALSGLHMGILYLIFDKLTRLLGHTPTARCLRAGLIVAATGFYTLMTGAGPSIVRAFLFILINETLKLLHRPRKPVRVLCLALLVQLVLNPSAITSVGFQLSYLAMAGIFLLYPILEKWYPDGLHPDPLRKIWSMAALSISCQLFTAPLAWYRFHSFPRFFLLTNLLALPLTTVLMGTAVMTVALGGIGLCPPLLIKTTDLLARLLLWVLEVIASL